MEGGEGERRRGRWKERGREVLGRRGRRMERASEERSDGAIVPGEGKGARARMRDHSVQSASSRAPECLGSYEAGGLEAG